MENFQQKGFTVIRGIIPKTEANHLYQYSLKNVEFGNKDDGQVPGSPSFYQDPEMVILQKKLRPLIETHIQRKLLNVFTYHRVYRQGAILRAHKDSTRAEISASINLGQQGKPWDLWLLDYEENPHCITLESGDALVYYGNHLCHWRGKLDEGDFVSQVMFHFVDQHGKNTFAAKIEVLAKIRKWCRQLMGIKY